MSSEDHLHQETKMIKVKEHTVMLAAQYTLKCHQQLHPNYDLSTLPDPPRNIRRTAITKYRDTINLLPPPTSRRNLKRGIKVIHTSVVIGSINDYQINQIVYWALFHQK